MKHPFKLRRIGLLIVCAALAACGGSDDPDKLVSSAKTYLAKQDPKAAIIELKNALQAAPKSAEARFLLGKALLADGQAANAVVELGRALDLKHPQAQVMPVLARALNASGQSKKLIDEHSSVAIVDPAAAADFKVSLAAAYAAAGNRERAERELARALQASPDYIPARLLDARLKAAAGDERGALAIAEALLASAPREEEAWLLKGMLLARDKSQSAAALAAYRGALALRANSMPAHAGIVSLLLESRQLDEAAKQFAELKKQSPDHPETKWLEARIALQRGDAKQARKLVEPLLAAAPSDVRLLYLAGLADLMTGSIAQAEGALTKAMQSAPDNMLVRQLLARTELRLGQPAKALAAIQPLVDRAAPSGEELLLAAQAHLLNGDMARAQEYFARAAKADPTNTRSRTALAMTKMTQGDGQAALDELQGIAAADKGTAADLGLISALLRRKDYDAALKAIGTMEAKQPTNPVAAQLRGTVLVAKRDLAGARASYEQALKLDPKYFLATARLAALDVADKKPEAAKQRFERVLAAEPKHPQALMALVDLRAATGGTTAELTELLGNAIRANPSEPAPRLRLVDLQLRERNVKAALAAAQDAIAAQPDSPPILDALGTAQLASGDLNQASATFAKLAAAQPNSPLPLLRQADVRTAVKDDIGALQLLRRAASLAPTSLPVQSRLLQGLLVAGHQPEALELARTIQKARPAEAAGFEAEGDVEASRKNWASAATAFGSAQAKAKSTAIAIKLHTVLLNAKRGAEANAFAAGWLKESARDVRFISHLGDMAILTRDHAAAEARYLEVVKLEPDNAAALNNLAWLMGEQKKKGAVEFAEKATRLQPTELVYQDTLAGVLAAENQLDKALAVQKKVVDAQPDNAMFRMNLAKLYIRASDKPAARAELERVAKVPGKSVDPAEVKRLLATL